VVKVSALPTCRFCGRKWQPRAGVCSDGAYCDACSYERREAARAVFANEGKRTVITGGYRIRVRKTS
jgi:hypothetical protein